MTELRLSLPFPPSGNRYWRRRRDGTIYVSREAIRYRRSCALIAKQARVQPLAGRVRASYVFFYPPRSWGRDLGNCRKVLDDALEGVLWLNDRQIRDAHEREAEPESFAAIGVTVVATGERLATRAERDAAAAKRAAAATARKRGRSRSHLPRAIAARATPAVIR